MQPQEYYEQGSYEYELASQIWLSARDSAIHHAKRLTGSLPAALIPSGNDFISDKEVFLDVHKQIANRLLEPFLWHKVIITATEWSNFFKLRTHADAQLEIKTIADILHDLYYKETVDCPDEKSGCEVLHGQYEPTLVKRGEWHLPLLYNEDKELIKRMYGNEELLSVHSNPNLAILEFFKQVSVARCARVSYLTHDGKRDIIKDLELYIRLHSSGHWSPFEHVATPAWHYGLLDRRFKDERHGNLVGWKQHRKEFTDENCEFFRKY